MDKATNTPNVLDRLSSCILDRSICLFLSSTISFAVLSISQNAYVILSITYFLVEFLYFCIFQKISKNTIGKLVFGIKVRNTKGEVPSYTRLFLRWFLWWISIMCGGLLHITIFFTPERKTLYEMFSGTKTVFI